MSKNTVEQMVLTGFMGAGKTTAGPLAATELRLPFFDTDTWMEEELGINVPDLVSKDLATFRQLEADTLREILRYERGIIATGGGIVSTEVGRLALGQARLVGIPVVWLNLPFDETARRVALDPGRARPLFADITSAKKRYDERTPLYEETATHTVDAFRSPEEVATELVRIATRGINTL
jgi:shikimate kinase